MSAPGDLAAPTVFNRLTRHYEPVERLARIVLDNASIIDRTGETEAAVFLVDMIRLFEEFVRDRLTRYLTGRVDVHGQHHGYLDVYGKVRIIPDLIFRRGTRTVYVADTKYKLLTDGFARETDYYQLLAYATTFELPGGLLIYCQNDGDVPPECIVVHPNEDQAEDPGPPPRRHAGRPGGATPVPGRRPRGGQHRHVTRWPGRHGGSSSSVTATSP